MPAKANLKLVAPRQIKRAVPKRQTNLAYRKRGEHITPNEMEKLIEAAKSNRNGLRDSTMISMTYRHGLRASEITSMEWTQIDWDQAELSLVRAKKGSNAPHPIEGDEMRALRKLQREQEPKSKFVFVSELGSPMTTDSFNWLVKRAGIKAKLPVRIHAHMIRHAAGFLMANNGVDTRTIQSYLGHKSITSTAIYTELAAGRFKSLKGLWSK